MNYSRTHICRNQSVLLQAGKRIIIHILISNKVGIILKVLNIRLVLLNKLASGIVTGIIVLVVLMVSIAELIKTSNSMT